MMARKKEVRIPVNHAVASATDSARPKYFPILIVVVVLLTVLAFGLGSSSVKKQATPTCGDGTFYSSCSLVKPYFCSQGNLIEDASVCGCAANMTRRGNSCISSYQTGPKNLTLNYVLDGKPGEINLTVYEGMDKYLETVSRSAFYSGSEQPQRSDFELKSMNEPQQKNLLLPFVERIQNITTNRDDQVRIAISIVQNIPYGFSNRTIYLGGNLSVNYSRYPYEVLYENQGTCSEKSALLAFILRQMGYGVALFHYGPENHEAIGIKCPVEDSLGNSGYCFVETVGPSIITDNKLTYVNGITLRSTPEVTPLSQGASIGNWQEFRDAQQLEQLMQWRLPIVGQWQLNRLEKKYGLGGEYQIV